MPTAERASVLTDEAGTELTADQLAQEATEEEKAELESFEAQLSGKVLDDVPDLVNPDRVPETPATPEPEAVKKEDEVVPETEEPKYAKITEEQLARILTYSNDIEAVKAAMESRFGTAFGKLGSLSQTLKEMQTQTGDGQPVVVSEEDLAELKVDYPDLTPAIAKSLTRVMSKVKGGNRVVTKEVNPEEFSALVETKAKEVAEKIVSKQQFDDLADSYPDWEKIIGKAGTKTEFRTWLANEPAEYQNKVNTSDRPVVVERALDKFYKFKESAVKKTPESKTRKNAADARREQLKDAVTERGGSSQVSAKSEEEAFNDHMKKANLQ